MNDDDDFELDKFDAAIDAHTWVSAGVHDWKEELAKAQTNLDKAKSALNQMAAQGMTGSKVYNELSEKIANGVPPPKVPDCKCPECLKEYNKALKAHAELSPETQKLKVIKSDDIVTKPMKPKAILLGTAQAVAVPKGNGPTGSHAKGGKFGGVSNYIDADVATAREYMNDVLGVEEMSINGRALEHILAEVYASANDAFKLKKAVAGKEKAEADLAVKVAHNKQLSDTVKKLTDALYQSQEDLKNLEENGVVIRKLNKEKVPELITGRRIKE